MQKSSLLGNNSRRLFALELFGEPLESLLIPCGELLVTGKSMFSLFVFFSSGSLIYFDWPFVIRIEDNQRTEKLKNH
jgi:hypothetical protein